MTENKTEKTESDKTEKRKDQINLISEKNRYLSHLLRNQKKYLTGLILLLSGIVFLSNFFKNKPLLLGGESYYHLFNSLNFSGDRFYYFPLMLIQKFLSESLWFILPLIISISTILLFLKLAKRLELPARETFLFLICLVLTPAFIFNSLILSGYSFFVLLSITGFLLLSDKNKNLKWLSIIPFILATFIDFFSSLVLIMLQLTYFSFKENAKNRIFKDSFLKSGDWIIPAITAVLALFNLIFLKINFVIGPFHLEKIFPDLISDLGGLSGIGFFALILAISGFFLAWKRKNLTTLFVYILSIIMIIGYFFNTESIFYLSIMVSFLAAESFVKLFEYSWVIETLKKFTFLIIVLGIVFSTTTYLSRVSDYPPMAGEAEALSWIKDNTPEKSVIFSLPEESDYIKYFSQRKPFFQLHHLFLAGKEAGIREDAAKTILNSTYTAITFPILDQNNVSIMYITPELRHRYPAEQGLLFLLKNEKFKLVHSSEDNEVWMYQK